MIVNLYVCWFWSFIFQIKRCYCLVVFAPQLYCTLVPIGGCGGQRVPCRGSMEKPQKEIFGMFVDQQFMSPVYWGFINKRAKNKQNVDKDFLDKRINEKHIVDKQTMGRRKTNKITIDRKTIGKRVVDKRIGRCQC